MLKNVKSSYIILNFFEYITEKKKLKLLKYNKLLQKRLNISINNYIHFKAKYIIYESNGKGKEYYYGDILVFEGEYLNGERNGKGKEYYNNGNLRFEGEYLKGKKNGKGKEYYNNGNLRFEGEYLKGKRNGKGKEYYSNGNLRFEGEYINGKINGKEYDEEGHLISDFESINIDIISNRIAHSTQNNNSKLIRKEFLNGKLIFEGEYLNGKRNGKGKEYGLNKTLFFEGEYLNGKRNGKGKEYEFGLLLFEGEFLCDFRIKGKYYRNGKLYFEGDFRYNNPWNGKVYDKNDNVKYELINGTCKKNEFLDYKILFEGEYINDENKNKNNYCCECVII